MKIDLTATMYIVEGNQVALIYHKKLNKWLPPGGHLDPNETPYHGAKREAFEETGLEVEVYFQENIWVDQWNAKSLPRPFMSLLEEIPPHGNEPAHQHCDLVFVGYPVGGELKAQVEEVEQVRWFTMEEIGQLKPDEEIFVETVESIKIIMEQLPNLQKELCETATV